MGEMLHIQIGQAGNRVSNQFWKQIIQQHCLDNNGKLQENTILPTHHIKSFFEEQLQNTYKPRMISIDLGSSSMEQAFTSSLTNNLQLQNFIFSQESSRNLFPTVYLKFGPSLFNEIQDRIRTKIQKCDNYIGCLLAASISGGTGSGLVSLISQKLQQICGNRIVMPTIVVPSPNISNIIVQNYNASLALAKIGDSTANLLFQNQAILNMGNKSKNGMTDLNDVNGVVGKGLANLTSPLRFACDGNITLRKMANNLILYPRLNYLYMGLPYSYDPHQKIGVLVRRKLLSSFNASLTLYQKSKYYQFNTSKWITNYFIFRGARQQSYHLNFQIIKAFQAKTGPRFRNQQFKEAFFCQGIYPNFILTAVEKHNSADELSMSCLQNKTEISQFFLRVSNSVESMKRKRAYLHWYLQEGMELDEINEAYINLADTRSNYQELSQITHSCYGEEGYDSSVEDQQ